MVESRDNRFDSCTSVIASYGELENQQSVSYVVNHHNFAGLDSEDFGRRVLEHSATWVLLRTACVATSNNGFVHTTESRSVLANNQPLKSHMTPQEFL